MRKFHIRKLALLAALLAISSLGYAQPVFAQPQGGTGPFVNFSPIYAGHNDGDALGAVGSRAGIDASSLGADSTWDVSSSHTVDVYLVNINNETSTCGGVKIKALALSTGNGGSFSFTFNWPNALTKSAGPLYAACLHEQGVSGAKDYFSATPANAAGNPGAFLVVTDAPATLAVSPAMVNPGGTLTITGHNWVPNYSDNADDHITATIGTCNSGNVLGSQANILPDGSGTFSATFTIPAGTVNGNYQACAVSAGNAQRVDATSSVPAPTFQVALAATATTAPTATTVPTETPAPTATTAAAGASTSANENTTNGNGSTDNSVLIAVIIALIAMLALGGALLYFFLSRRGGSPPPPTDRGMPPFGGYPSSPDWGTNTQPNFDQAVTGKRPSSWGQPAPLPPDENTQQGPPVIWG